MLYLIIFFILLILLIFGIFFTIKYYKTTKIAFVCDNDLGISTAIKILKTKCKIENKSFEIIGFLDPIDKIIKYIKNEINIYEVLDEIVFENMSSIEIIKIFSKLIDLRRNKQIKRIIKSERDYSKFLKYFIRNKLCNMENNILIQNFDKKIKNCLNEDLNFVICKDLKFYDQYKYASNNDWNIIKIESNSIFDYNRGNNNMKHIDDFQLEFIRYDYCICNSNKYSEFFVKILNLINKIEILEKLGMRLKLK